MKTKFVALIIFLFVTNAMAGTECHTLKEECLDPGETRVVGPEKVPLKLDCWRYKVTYECEKNNEEVFNQPIEEIHNEKSINNQEEDAPLIKICEKVPSIRIKEEFFPGCQMHSSPGSVSDCLAGGVQIPFYSGTGYGKIVIPKNRGARVGFSDSRHPYCYITITNETTGHVVIAKRQVSNGYYIELPRSETQDQTFSFVVERWYGCSCDQPGRMNIYIDYKCKMAKVESWREINCNES